MPLPRLISIGELFDRTWEHYHKHFFIYTGISSTFLISTFVALVALSFWPGIETLSTLNTGATSLSGLEITAILLYVANLLLAPILSLWILASIARATKDPERMASSPVPILKEGARLILPTFVVSALIALILIGLNLAALVPGSLMYLFTLVWDAGVVSFLGAALLTIGVLFGFVASAYVSVKLVFAPYLPALTGERGISAIKASKSLTDGRFWGVLIRIIAPKIIFLVLGIFVLYVLNYFAGLFITSVGGLNINIATRLSLIINQVLPSLILIFINPLIVIADILLLQNILSKKSPTMRPSSKF